MATNDGRSLGIPISKERRAEIALADASALHLAAISYGDSWKKRGGVGAFMMLARKWDRIENQLQKPPKGDLFGHLVIDKRKEGLIDDIVDLRRYLLLVQTEHRDASINAQTQYVIQNNPGWYLGPNPYKLLADYWAIFELETRRRQWNVFHWDLRTQVTNLHRILLEFPLP